jgi:hypothetical protein
MYVVAARLEPEAETGVWRMRLWIAEVQDFELLVMIREDCTGVLEAVVQTLVQVLNAAEVEYMMAVVHAAVAEKVDHNSAAAVRIAEVVGSIGVELLPGEELMALVAGRTTIPFSEDTALGTLALVPG